MTRADKGRLAFAVVGTMLTLAAACSGHGRPSPTAATSGATAPEGTTPSASPATTRSATTGSTRPATGTASASPARPARTFTLAFAGDVNFAGRTATRLARNPATAFGVAAPGLRRADVTMVNLETAITTGGSAQAKEFRFKAPPVALTALRAAGIDVATMANNHGADYGAAGLRDTLAAIRSRKFPVIGIGADAAAAYAPYTATLNGTRVAIIAADQVQDETTLRLFSAGPGRPGVANAYSERLITAVKKARAAGYVVVVYLHWGVEYQTCPSADQTTLAGRLAKLGVAAVIGTHAHVLLGAGWRRDGTYVAYGLGNYLWWMSFGNNQDDNGVLTLSFRAGRVADAAFAPSHLDDTGVPVPAKGAQKQRILDELAHDRRCTDLSANPPS